LFFDYNGNGKQDGEEPAVPDSKVQLKDNTGKVIAEAVTDSSGDYELEDIRSGSYGLCFDADKKFRYMCTSPEEFRAVTNSYDVLLDESKKMDVGLMEGFLTLPFPKDVKIVNIIYVDLDSGEGYRDWMGNNPNYFRKFSCRGGVNNHLGTDFLVGDESPVVASAPGKVVVIESSWPKQPKSDWLAWEDGNGVVIEHGPNIYTIYCHLKEIQSNLKEGQWVTRGYGIGSADRTGDFPSCERYAHLHFQLDMGGFGWDRRVDPYRDLSDSASVSYWTKDNDPQYAIT
jgi:hypothetical protein